LERNEGYSEFVRMFCFRVPRSLIRVILFGKFAWTSTLVLFSLSSLSDIYRLLLLTVVKIWTAVELVRCMCHCGTL